MFAWINLKVDVLELQSCMQFKDGYGKYLPCGNVAVRAEKWQIEKYFFEF